MNKLPVELRSVLDAWTERSRIPEYEQPGYNEFYDIVGEVGCLELDEDEASASARQRIVIMLMQYLTTVPVDGIALGLVVNNPHVLIGARDAARDAGLKRALRYLQSVVDAAPAHVLEIDDPEERFGWFEQNSDDANKLDELDDTDEAGEAKTDMMLFAMREVAENRDEFFDKPL